MLCTLVFITSGKTADIGKKSSVVAAESKAVLGELAAKIGEVRPVPS